MAIGESLILAHPPKLQNERTLYAQQLLSSQSGRGNRLGSIPVGQVLGGKAVERGRIATLPKPLAKMVEAELAVETARRVPVKHLKIDPLPAALDRNSGKPGHQSPSDPLSTRLLGDKQIFEIHPGSAEPSREPGMGQGQTGGLAVEKGEQRLELPLGSEAIAAQIFLGSDDSV